MNSKHISEVEMLDLIFPVSSSKSVYHALQMINYRPPFPTDVSLQVYICSIDLKCSDGLHSFVPTSLDHYSYERPEDVHRNEPSSLPSYSNAKKKFTYEQLLARDDVFPDIYNLNYLQSRFNLD